MYSGKLLDLVARTLRVSKSGNSFEYAIEVARRPPGVRLLVKRDSRYLLLKEFRAELGRWDYRLAGGKVFESQSDHLDFLRSGEDLGRRLLAAATAEAREELGIAIESAHLFRKSSAGATVDWDLYFFEVDEFTPLESGPQPEATELLKAEWRTQEEVLQLIKDDLFSEDRSIGVFLQHMLTSGKSLICVDPI
ncbi:MAG: hypothetical protein E6Q88_01770 [Lysobacteraceae bacterium]|nr:MAG: hypothetical protein E6Q88_01770 [Xanthomonadaceae bacterium]